MVATFDLCGEVGILKLLVKPFQNVHFLQDHIGIGFSEESGGLQVLQEPF